MASSLFCNLLSKPVVSFCLGAAAFASYSRLFRIKEEDSIFVEVDGYGPIVWDVVNIAYSSLTDAIFPKKSIDPSLTRDLAHSLNSIERDIYVKPRWDVKEDNEALYLLRNMSGLDKKDVVEYLEFPSGHNRFFDYRMNVFGSVRVYRITQYPPASLVIKYLGREVNPKQAYVGYKINIDLPGRFFKTLDVTMDVKDDILTITIPKRKGKRIYEISRRINIVNFLPGEKERSEKKGMWIRDVMSSNTEFNYFLPAQN